MKKLVNWLAKHGLSAFFVLFSCGAVAFPLISHAMQELDLLLPCCIWLAVCGELLVFSIFAKKRG